MTTYAVQDIPPGSIVAGNNDRRHFDPVALQALADSIAADGLGQPPTVRPMPDGSYQLVCGERRTRAMRDVLGWASIPCIVRPMTDIEASALMLSENTARADLDPVEEARAFQSRLDSGLTRTEIARTAGRSIATLNGRLALLTLSEQTLQLVSRGSLPLGHAAMMAGLDVNRQLLACRAYDAGRLDAAGMGAVCDRLMLEQGSESMFDTDSFMQVGEYVSTAVVEVQAQKDAPAAELAQAKAAYEHAQARIRDLELALAETSGTSTMLGTQEIAKHLGVKLGTVHQWQTRRRLPSPDAIISGLPAWTVATIDGWARSTGRKVA